MCRDTCKHHCESPSSLPVAPESVVSFASKMSKYRVEDIAKLMTITAASLIGDPMVVVSEDLFKEIADIVSFQHEEAHASADHNQEVLVVDQLLAAPENKEDEDSIDSSDLL
ncbi:hypothetical protein PFISCL1PPCAC_7708, partial [Pristionchus fissidentatus]